MTHAKLSSSTARNRKLPNAHPATTMMGDGTSGENMLPKASWVRR
jgi:hypothetical protein